MLQEESAAVRWPRPPSMWLNILRGRGKSNNEYIRRKRAAQDKDRGGKTPTTKKKSDRRQVAQVLAVANGDDMEVSSEKQTKSYIWLRDKEKPSEVHRLSGLPQRRRTG